MREVFGSVKDMTAWVLWLFDQVWHWGLSVAVFASDVWRYGPLWKQISFLTFIALLGSMALTVGPKALLFIRRMVGGFACLLVVVMMVLPTLTITFLAVVGGIWIAKSF
jgi:hypothetical protein